MTTAMSRFFRIVFLALTGLAVLLAIAGWAGTLSAREYAPFYWLFLVLGLAPVLGGCVILICAIMLIWKQRLAVWELAALLAGLAAFAPLLWQITIGSIAYPVSLSQMKPEITVRWPFDRPGRVAWGGDDMRVNYHVAAPDQRWAYDLVIEPAFNGAKSLDAYGCFGKPVLASARGVVVLASDGMPDHLPTITPATTRPLGNHIAIKLAATGTYLLIAHLKNGSIKVRQGDRVGAGQQIGACGNSGNSSEPHVHIHHQRQHPETRPFNFAEGLPLYFDTPFGPVMPRGGFSKEGKPIGDTLKPFLR